MYIYVDMVFMLLSVFNNNVSILNSNRDGNRYTIDSLYDNMYGKKTYA